MKLLRSLVILAMTGTLLGSGAAWADRGHGHGGHGHGSIGFYFGPGPFYYPYYARPYYAYPYPYYAYPPVVVSPAPQAPPVYIEQGSAGQAQTPEQSAAAQDYYWYHCDKPEGYYPYIKECPAGWQKVTPKPPDQ